MISDRPSPLEFSGENERSLRSLIRSVSLLNEQEFALKLVRCNYNDLRQRVMTHLRQTCSLPIQSLTLKADTLTLVDAIETTFSTAERAELRVLSIHGFEQVADLEGLFSATNQVRDAFHQRFPFLMLLWMTDDVLPLMIRRAPDFYNWAASPSSFVPSREDLLHGLTDQTERLWATLLQSHRPLFPQGLQSHIVDADGTSVGDAALFPLQSWELKSLQQDLDTHAYDLQPELKANLDLLWGRDYFRKIARTSWGYDRETQRTLDQAIAHYQKSLDIWQTQPQPIRAGFLGIHLGLCYWRKAEGDRAHQEDHWQDAADYFREALAGFEGGDRLDLKARFIGYLSETLKRLQQWDDLDILVREALDLHQSDTQGRDIYALERARDYSFKAELALQQQAYQQAKTHVEEALAIVDRLPQPCLDCSLFLSLLAQADYHLGNTDAAKQHLRTTLDYGSKAENPQLYIGILDQLREIYFQQKNYREAFECKRKKNQLQNQYGFQAFIGAGRLQPKESADGQAIEVSPEIAVSGRQRDVDALWERIVDKQCRLTILHGPLGVGKSSILQAGLIPTLQSKRIETRKILSVMTRTYTNCQWAEKLGEKLASQLQQNPDQAVSTPQSADTILTQLQANSRSNLVTVLIFDQFEEFFFNCREISERQTFFSFLSQCLNILHVNVILSLREDYLHYLLEWERYAPTPTEGQIQLYKNILSQEHRYPLGNFTPEDAKAILDKLTERAQFYMEEELRDRIVQNLTVNGEVKPIELQVVGFQLQSEGIVNLNIYRTVGKKQINILVQKYLESIIQDCGSENKRAANLILYVLTDENNTRPPKTRHEIETEIENLEQKLVQEIVQIELILYIFQKAGLIFLIPEAPTNRYQLIHDYLVTFIRSKRTFIRNIVDELKRERKLHSRTKEKIKIIELEKKLEKENYQAEKEKLERALVERRLHQKIVILTLSLVSIAVFLGIFIYSRSVNKHNLALFKKARNDQINSIILFYLRDAEKKLNPDPILKHEAEDLAAISIIRAGQLLGIQDEGYKEDIIKIKIVKAFQSMLKDEPLNSSKSSTLNQVHFPEYLNDNQLENLSSDELNNLTQNWLKSYCQVINSDDKILNKFNFQESCTVSYKLE
ncbi:MAG: hypothetical protein AAGD25_01200 [Cyanobacteria bacterium P01_F01_bin.150]